MTKKQLNDLQKRIEDNNETVSDQDCLKYLSEVFDIPMETLVDRLKAVRNNR